MVSLRAHLPLAAWVAAREGIDLLTDYQDVAYARDYGRRLEALAAHAGGDVTLITQAARYLATWMAYEDVMRIAQLRLRLLLNPLDQRAIRSASVLNADALHLQGPELCHLLPSKMARKLERCLTRRNLKDRLSLRLPLRVDSRLDRARLQLVASLRRWRASSLAFHEEQRLIGAWWLRVSFATRSDLSLALEIVRCAELIHGRGEDRRRSHATLQRICDVVIDPILDGLMEGGADAVRDARIAAGAAAGTALRVV